MVANNKQKGKDAGPVERRPLTCIELWNEFDQRNVKSSPQSKQDYRRALARFFSFFKECESVSDLTRNQMFQWKEFMLRSLSPPTAAVTVRRMKTMFRFAVMEGWIVDNPLQDVSVKYSPTWRDSHFFTKDEYLTLLKHCPSKVWRTILALVRYGGMRCPCEVMLLRWSDIDWNGKRMSIPNPKWAHYSHKRIVPLFPKVRRELQALFESRWSNEFVIEPFANRGRTNLATRFRRIATTAGIGNYGKPLLDMRNSRFHELIEKFGRFYASVWLGVEPPGKEKFVLRVTDEIIQQAAEWDG